MPHRFIPKVGYFIFCNLSNFTMNTYYLPKNNCINMLMPKCGRPWWTNACVMYLQGCHLKQAMKTILSWNTLGSRHLFQSGLCSKPQTYHFSILSLNPMISWIIDNMTMKDCQGKTKNFFLSKSIFIWLIHANHSSKLTVPSPSTSAAFNPKMM